MKELWNNEKGKAGITLGLWIMFIAFIFIFVSCSGSSKDVTLPLETKEVLIKDIIDASLSNKIDYKITYEENTNKIIYNVTYNDNNYEGYIEDVNGVTKFRCDLDKCYNVLIDHEEEIEDYYFKDDLNIFSIKDISELLIKEKDNTYLYNLGDKSYKIIIDNDLITKIIINTTNYVITYDLNYK